MTGCMLSVSPLWWRVEQADALTRQRGRKLLHIVFIVANLPITGVEGHHQAADLAIQAGSKLYTDSASSYRLITGYEHDSVNHTKKEYARGDVHENRAECLFSLLKPYLRVFRGISKINLPGYVGFFQFLRNFHQLTAFEQAEMILYAALDPSIASKAKKGEFVKCLDHFDLLQSARN
jgi:transposase